MGCTHADTCPLHPRLNNSLAGWRAHYCDDDVEWKFCARYEMSLTGNPVPLALLPNGKMIGGPAAHAGGEAGAAAAQSAPADGATEPVAGGGVAVAVMTDEEADQVLEQAQSSTGRFWKRFKNLFGGF